MVTVSRPIWILSKIEEAEIEMSFWLGIELKNKFQTG